MDETSASKEDIQTSDQPSLADGDKDRAEIEISFLI